MEETKVHNVSNQNQQIDDLLNSAHTLRCSETTVSWRVFAARKKLKRFLTANE
jgi:hypothetical protein